MEKFDRKMWETPAKRFKALGHPVRMWIAAQLMDGEKCVHEFVDRVDLDFSTVSQHLSGLKVAGVVEADKRQGSLLPAEMQLRTQLSQVRRGEKKIRSVLNRSGGHCGR